MSASNPPAEAVVEIINSLMDEYKAKSDGLLVGLPEFSCYVDVEHNNTLIEWHAYGRKD